MPMLSRLLFALLLALAGATPAAASNGASAPEPLQFYIFSFTEVPAEEAAHDIVTGALAHDLEIDPAIDGLVTFRADGWYTEDALLRDFGTALLDQDVALVRTGAGAYALVPRVNAPMLMARGGVVMRLAEPQAAAPDAAPLDAGDAPDRPARWWEGAAAALAVFFAGAAAGAAALFGGQILHRRADAEHRRLAPPPLRLTDQSRPPPPSADTSPVDPELVIPRFERRG